jgi:Leucine-rich repeat (LRR) protein
VLDLWRCSTLTARGVAGLAACSRLKDLDLGWCLGVQAATGALLSLVEACQGLRRLCLTAHRQTGDRELAALGSLPGLEQLDILGNRTVSLGAVQQLLAALPSLRLLDCSFCEQLGEQGVCQLRAAHPGVAIKWSFTDPAS